MPYWLIKKKNGFAKFTVFFLFLLLLCEFLIKAELEKSPWN